VERFPEITYRSTGLTSVGADPWGGTRAAFRATAELHRDDFAMNYNQVVQAGIAAIGTTLKVELEIQAVQGETLPQA
jgi:polyisoprenoid-binding protein YceI